MSIIDAALERSRTVLALLAFILVAGGLAYYSIPKESDPDVNLPILYIPLHLDGISPKDAERLMVRPTENEVRSVEGVKEMRSVVYEGGGSVVLEFEAGFDVDKALQDVREKIDVVKPLLPADADEPTVHEVNLSLFPILLVTISGDAPERMLLKLARELRDDIQALPQVLEAEIQGDREEMVEIIIDPVRLESYGLNPTAIFNLFSRSNVIVAAGSLDDGSGRFAVKVPGLFEDVRDILAMPLKTEGDAVVSFSDVASVRRAFKDPVRYARVDGEPAITLEISKRVGQNVIETSEAVRAVVEATRQSWPANVTVGYSQDESFEIRDMLRDLQNNVTSAVLLVLIVVVAFLGLRGGILVGLAIPGSFLTGILLLYIGGLTVNIVVLFSLILAVGMLVDGAIVVVEYADRKLGEGLSKDEAYGQAAKRMAWPIIASTATTLAAFLPLLFWPGIVGEFMKYLPITLIMTLSASLAMALIFVPVLGAKLAVVGRLIVAVLGILAGMMAARWLAGTMPGAPSWLLMAGGAVIGAVIGILLGGRVQRGLEGTSGSTGQAALAGGHADLEATGPVTRLYLKVLRRALKRPRVIMATGVGVLLGTYALYGLVGHGVEFFPDVEPDIAVLNVHARGNLSVDESDSLVAQVEDRVLALQRERGEFRSIYTTSGTFEVRSDDAEDIIGKITLEFADWDQRRPAAEIRSDLTDRVADLTGIRVEFRQDRAGPSKDKPIYVQLSSQNEQALKSAARLFRARFDSMDGLIDVEDSAQIPAIEWVLDVDRAQAAKFGVDVMGIGQFIQFLTRGLKISDYRPDDSEDEIGIFIRFPEESRTLDRLDQIRIITDQGEVPISNFVTRHAQQKTSILRRDGGARTMFVKADVVEGVLPDDKVQEIRAWMSQAELPQGVKVTFKGEDEDQKEAQAFLQNAFAVALFLMAVILVTQFNSFYSAFLILFAVIMSTAGVLIGLLIINEPFGIVMSGVGVIALAGIVVNNNIVLIDTFDQLVKTEKSVLDAILLTGAQRLRPVLLTTVTTILGLMPMVLQLNIDFVSREITRGAPSTQWWVQLATAIVFGLAFSTVLTLVMTPSALMLRANFVERRQRGERRRRRVRPGPASASAVTASPQDPSA